MGVPMIPANRLHFDDPNNVHDPDDDPNNDHDTDDDPNNDKEPRWPLTTR